MPLRSVCESVDYGYTASASAEPIGPRFLRITDIVRESLDWEQVPFCEIEADKFERHRLRDGDIVVARTGATTGWAKYISDPPEAVFASYLVRLRPNEGTDGRYVGYVAESAEYKHFIQQHMGGAAQPNANAQVLASFELPLPSLAEQRRIAGILSTYDELIENSQRRIKILETMARALYREWFVHFRFPGYENHPRVASPLGEIPKGWAVVPFAGLASYVNGYAFKPDDWMSEGKPIIKIKELKNGVTADTPRNHGKGVAEKFIVRDGDVLFSWSADLEAYLWMGGEGLLNQHLFNVLPAEGVSRAYCFHALREAMPRFRALSLGATMHHIKRSALDQVHAVRPSPDLAQQFDGIVEPIHDAICILSCSVNTLRRTRDLLLPRLLSGQLEVGAD